jgi:ribosomal protein L11 methyltransferase
MPWLQISCAADRDSAPVLERALEDAGALSVTLADAGDEPVLEPGPGETPLWSRVRITALFDERTDPLPVAALLTGLPGGPAPADVEIGLLEDRVWEREWLSRFRPMRFGRRLWVCPGGQTPPDPRAVCVRLDPGLAFGTGTHPTTQMCLRWLDGAELSGREVVDYGCGSGILAIAAALLGAGHVVAIDNDDQALTATRDNAALNGVAARVEVRGPPETPPDADVLLANILAGPLIELAPLFGAAVRPGGSVVLSGILADQGSAVATAYAPWFDLAPPTAEDGWLCFGGRRNRTES